jgi:hypothetical protein
MTVTTIAYTLAALLAAGIVFIGARFIVAPRVAAAGYGVESDLGQRSVGAYLKVKASATSQRGSWSVCSSRQAPRTWLAGRC